MSYLDELPKDVLEIVDLYAEHYTPPPYPNSAGLYSIIDKLPQEEIKPYIEGILVAYGGRVYNKILGVLDENPDFISYIVNRQINLYDYQYGDLWARCIDAEDFSTADKLLKRYPNTYCEDIEIDDLSYEQLNYIADHIEVMGEGFINDYITRVHKDIYHKSGLHKAVLDRIKGGDYSEEWFILYPEYIKLLLMFDTGKKLNETDFNYVLLRIGDPELAFRIADTIPNLTITDHNIYETYFNLQNTSGYNLEISKLLLDSGIPISEDVRGALDNELYYYQQHLSFTN